MRALIAVVLAVLLAACGGPGGQVSLTTIEGEWSGTITSVPYDFTGPVTLSIGPREAGAASHTATMQGLGTDTARTIFCRSDDLAEMDCYRYGTSTSWTLIMTGTIQGRTWSGTFSFSDPSGPDNGTFSFTKRL